MRGPLAPCVAHSQRQGTRPQWLKRTEERPHMCPREIAPIYTQSPHADTPGLVEDPEARAARNTSRAGDTTKTPCAQYLILFLARLMLDRRCSGHSWAGNEVRRLPSILTCLSALRAASDPGRLSIRLSCRKSTSSFERLPSSSGTPPASVSRPGAVECEHAPLQRRQVVLDSQDGDESHKPKFLASVPSPSQRICTAS